jgi:hypothetical protein
MTDIFSQIHDAKTSAAFQGDVRPQRFGGDPEVEITEEKLRYDPRFIENSKIVYELMQGDEFNGDDDEAHEYGINIMSSFTWNFANPIAGEVAGIEIRPGMARQAATLMASGSRQHAKAWVYLFDQYERLPDFTASGTYRAIRDLLTDPGIIAGGITTMAARKAGMKGITGLIRKMAEKPLTSAAVLGGAATGTPAVAEAVIEEQAGFEEPLLDRAGDVALETAIGAAAGPALVKGGEALVKGVEQVVKYGTGEQ